MSNIFEKKQNIIFIAIFYTFLWGSAFPLVKLCMEGFDISDDMSKCLLAGIRFAISGLILTAYNFVKDKKDASPKKIELKYFISYGALATSLQYAFTYIGLSRVNGSVGAIYDQLCVFLIIIFAGLFDKNDKLNLKKLLGCVIGFFGVTLVSTGGGEFSFSLLGDGMMILAAFCQTAAYFVASGSAKNMSARKLVGYGQLFGGIILTGFSLFAGGRIMTVSPIGIITLIGLSLISAIAYVLSLIPLKYFPASEISVFNLLITVFGVVMSALVLGENIFKISYLAALIFISVGIFCVNNNN
ncbi:MAG: DMT family transporter [Clostridia bacterium]|nr:DMT family transporter [Clostridia bacterium]